MSRDEISEDALDLAVEYLIKEANYAPDEAYTFNIPDEVVTLIKHLKAQGSISDDIFVFITREVAGDEEEDVDDSEYLTVQRVIIAGGPLICGEQQDWEEYDGWADMTSFRDSVREVINGINKAGDDITELHRRYFVRMA